MAEEKKEKVRPCMVYKGEYDDCTSIKARFNQYFIFGKILDCSQWKINYCDCYEWEKHKSEEAFVCESIAEYKSCTDIPLRKILVSNLDRRTTCTDLRSLFSEYGCVEECSIYVNINNMPCAYITFENEKNAIRALTQGNNVLHGNYLEVKSAGYYQQPENLQQLLLTSDRLSEIWNFPTSSYNFDDLWNDVDKPSLNVLNDDCLEHVFSFLPIIDKLRVEIVCKRWKGLSQVSWSTMRTLDFTPSTWGMSERDIIFISSGAFRGVLSRCGKFLREVNLKDSDFKRERNKACCSIPQSFSMNTLSEIGERCPNLKKFDTSALVMTREGIDILTHTCPRLTTISLRSLVDSRYSDIKLQVLIRKKVKLEHFEISESNFYGIPLIFLPKETMHTLIIDGCSVLDQYLAQALKRLTNLRDLRIIDCNNVKDLTISVINNYCTNLRILKLKYLYHAPMAEFKNPKLINLEALSIRYNSNFTNDILFSIVQYCTKLTKINIRDCPVTNDGIEFFQELFDLRVKCRYFNTDMCDDYY